VVDCPANDTPNHIAGISEIKIEEYSASEMFGDGVPTFDCPDLIQLVKVGRRTILRARQTAKKN